MNINFTVPWITNEQVKITFLLKSIKGSFVQACRN